jgi:hypothetical protein
VVVVDAIAAEPLCSLAVYHVLPSHNALEEWSRRGGGCQGTLPPPPPWLQDQDLVDCSSSSNSTLIR